jgi:hypothetical protein
LLCLFLLWPSCMGVQWFLTVAWLVFPDE